MIDNILECPITGLKWKEYKLSNTFKGCLVCLTDNVVVDFSTYGGASAITIFHVRVGNLWASRNAKLYSARPYLPNSFLSGLADYSSDTELRPLPKLVQSKLPSWHLISTGYLYEAQAEK